jgi:PAS domain S-box-containing protein
VYDNNYSLNDISGETLGYQGTIHKMSTFLYQKKTLTGSKDKLSKISDVSFEGIVIQEDEIIVTANTAFARLLDREIHEVIGKNMLEFVVPKHRSNVKRNYYSNFQGIYEVPTLRKDGTTFLAEVSLKIVYQKGKVVRIYAVRDISERRKMELELKESEEKLRVMFQSITEGVIVYDLKGIIKQANDAAADLFDFQNKDELIGLDVLSLFAESVRDQAKKNGIMRLSNLARHDVEYTCVRKNNTPFPAEFKVSLMKDESGNASDYIAVIADITERARFEQNRQYYISEITKAHEEERRRLACELHDEIIQSLVAISLDMTSLNKYKKQVPYEINQMLKLLQRKTNRIISNVRQFSQELRPSVLDELGLVPALELLVGELNQKNINTIFIKIGLIRRLSADAEIVLFRVTQEAFRNIWKHSQATQANVTLRTSPHVIKVVISDNGIGFNTQEQQNVAASKGKFGLISMKERMSLIGGTFHLASKRDKGTVITIKVPV